MEIPRGLSQPSSSSEIGFRQHGACAKFGGGCPLYIVFGAFRECSTDVRTRCFVRETATAAAAREWRECGASYRITLSGAFSFA